MEQSLISELQFLRKEDLGQSHMFVSTERDPRAIHGQQYLGRSQTALCDNSSIDERHRIYGGGGREWEAIKQ